MIFYFFFFVHFRHFSQWLLRPHLFLRLSMNLNGIANQSTTFRRITSRRCLQKFISFTLPSVSVTSQSLLNTNNDLKCLSDMKSIERCDSGIDYCQRRRLIGHDTEICYNLLSYCKNLNNLFIFSTETLYLLRLTYDVNYYSCLYAILTGLVGGIFSGNIT